MSCLPSVCILEFVEQHPFYSGTKRELLLLHCSVNLERPEYDGPRLKNEHAHEYEKVYYLFVLLIKKGTFV